MQRGKTLAEIVLGIVVVMAVVAVAFSIPRAPDAAPGRHGLAVAMSGPKQGEALQEQFVQRVYPFLVKHCYHCHGNGKHKGDLTLDRFTSLAAVQADRKTWQSIADMLSQRQMPPENRSQPTQAEVNLMLAWASEAMEYVDTSGPRDPGRVTLRRLNRVEYNNTIRDLVGVDFKPAKDFPADDTGYGFDNIGDVLSMSPLLAEKYLTAAEQILDKAIVTESPFKKQIAHYDGKGMASTIETGTAADKARILNHEGELYFEHEFVTGAEYAVRVRAWATQAGDEPARMTLRLGEQELQTFDVKATRREPATYRLRMKFEAGKKRFAAAFTNDYQDQENPDPRKRDRNLIVDFVEIEGPINPAIPPPSAAYRQIVFCAPGPDLAEAQGARQIIARFATRAFRRPVRDSELDQLMRLYAMARGEGDNFVQSVKVALTAVLVSPHFLFRIELDPAEHPGRAHPLNDCELATRLSYFLWRSMPDAELFELAAAGKMRERGMIEAQVKRMLADEKSAALVTNFAGQWLELRNLDEFVPDPVRFAEFDDQLRVAMKQEAEIYFQTLIREDRSLLELLDSDYTFVNERLAKHYGLSGITGNLFRRVSVAGTHRGGVLTMASVLSVTAMPSRTSPVKRGKFVLEQILGSPPPPPPPDVPALSEKPQDIAAASMRQRLEQHRESPNCAVCHRRMDPIGFSMENFNAIGAWREKDGGFAIDPSGKLPDGEALDGPAGLKRVLLKKKKDFVRCFVGKMLTYALGRGMEEYDRATVREICQGVEKNDYRFSALVMGIVQSDAFQKRRSKRGDE